MLLNSYNNCLIIYRQLPLPRNTSILKCSIFQNIILSTILWNTKWRLNTWMYKNLSVVIVCTMAISYPFSVKNCIRKKYISSFVGAMAIYVGCWKDNSIINDLRIMFHLFKDSSILEIIALSWNFVMWETRSKM